MIMVHSKSSKRKTEKKRKNERTKERKKKQRKSLYISKKRVMDFILRNYKRKKAKKKEKKGRTYFLNGEPSKDRISGIHMRKFSVGN